jgi:hypothetical protein
LKEIGFFTADTAQAGGTLFPIILYVNLYCGRLRIDNRAMPEQRRTEDASGVRIISDKSALPHGDQIL